MEWTLHVSQPGDVRADFLPSECARQSASSADSRIQKTMSVPFRLMDEVYGRIHASRIAFGTEFCENLIGDPHPLTAVLAEVRRQGLDFTFLTPYVSDRGIARLRPLFAVLLTHAERVGRPMEVVFNDWGVLRLLRREFPELEPVQGRLLNKSLRDPRITGLLPDSPSGLIQLSTTAALKQTNLDSSGYVQLLLEMGVGRVELDNLPQGLDLEAVPPELKIGVYVPFGFVATARACMAAGLGYEAAQKFVHGASCKQECQTHHLIYTYTNSPFPNRDQEFYLKGNTYFYGHTDKMLRNIDAHALEGRIDRFMFQPHLPMWN